MAQPAPPAEAAPQEQRTFLSRANLQSLLQSAAIYFAITYGLGALRSKPAVPDPTAAVGPLSTSQMVSVDPAAGVTAPGAAPATFEVVPLWPPGSVLDVVIKLSTAEDGRVNFGDDSLPSVEWKGIELGDTKWSKEWETVWDVPVAVQNNGSLWADLFATLSGGSPDPTASNYDADNTLHVRKILTRYMPKVKVRAVKNLLAGTKETEAEIKKREALEAEEDKEVMPIISYYHPNVTFEMVSKSGLVAHSGLPEALSQWIKIAHEGKRNAEDKGFYFPITWANDFWLLREHMMPLNETTPKLPLHITLKPSAFWKFQVMASLDDQFAKQAASTGKPGDLDVLKRTLTDTSPWLLITTAVVSLLHMLFEFLAFTSDITHWRNKKELVGVSVRTILTNCFVQLVILLYLIDNNDNTSWMILGGQGVGLVIEAWKINKAVDIAIVPAATSVLGYKLKITDKHVLSEEELQTQEYDQLAFRWVSYGTFPALVAYTIYSLMYNEHRGWYSFTISTLTSFVYMFGFVQLIPQLIINWKLKSVAHMPMKTMTYKFFNTIVDDFFSFVIKMPLLHRVACFRDDVVFVVLLWQMYIYRVDPTRSNEYGQKLTEEEAAKLLAELEAKKKGTPVPGKKAVKETKKTQ